MSADPAPAPAERAGGLDRDFVRGVAWTAAVKWSSQLLTWASTLIVARILTPEDYGIVGMATVFLSLVTLISEFGLGTAIVIRRDLSRTQLAQVNSLALAVGAACLALSLLAAKPLGAFFDNARLPTVVMVMSAAFSIASFRTVPLGLLTQELRFKLLAGIEAAQSVMAAIATVALAALGLGYWALVFGKLVNTSMSTALSLVFRRHGFGRPRRRDVRPVLSLSSHIITSRLSWYVYSNADFLVIGKVLGEAALGAYTIGWTLASIPVEKIAAMVARVTPAVFSAVQDETAELRRYFLSVTEGLALISVPLAWGLALVTEDFVRLVLGDKWEAAILPLQLLAAYAAVRCITPLLTHVLSVTGHTRFAMRMGLVSAVALPIGFYLGSRWGTGGVAGAWIAVHPLVMMPLYARTFRVLELGVGGYLRTLWPAASAGGCMAAAVLGLEAALPPDWPRVAGFGAKVAVGGATYALVLLAFHRPRLRAARDVLRMLRR